MITKDFFSIDIEIDGFENELQNHLMANEYQFTLKWTQGKAIALLNASLQVGRKKINLLNQPYSDNDGTINIPLGLIEGNIIRVYFRVYAITTVPKMKAFLIDKTNRKIVKKNPATSATKKLTKGEIWNSKV
ncbi:hypothetical protein [uncultured Tenacibaculum sp.]|uniref:hypothetical protein n=1 Tax=uncultured Tenacibaculum sp. TaxID=174713 RepID=UPI0026057AAA|nr:hypothetical protein [uncultured Tenacibaculum sp.]